jgi:hypothetical protein
MAYESVDKLQKALAENVFHYAKDSKKAAGRALGTLVEIITFYLLKNWGLDKNISIEKGLPEYGNPEITHNVEYSLHPLLRTSSLRISVARLPITTQKILQNLKDTAFDLSDFEKKNSQLLDKNRILRNACIIGRRPYSLTLSSIEKEETEHFLLHIYEQHIKPFAIFECKRVGVEEGMAKGPQTIEKAKQGAYVARAASSLQKVRNENGEMFGIVYRSDNSFIIKPYHTFLEEVIRSDDSELLRKFILTVGIVSNHGNWFSSENQNKELKVLAQSYDWLLFLTDTGLSEFIETLLLNPSGDFEPIKRAFSASYAADKTKNEFTKVQMNLEADAALQRFFVRNSAKIESWFNVISPKTKSLKNLRAEIESLKNKNWKRIL